MIGGMAIPDIYTGDIFRFADLCIDAGFFAGFRGKHYVLLLVWENTERCVIRRAMANAVLPRPCRVWICKGRLRRLLGDSHCLPADLSSGVLPPYIV